MALSPKNPEQFKPLLHMRKPLKYQLNMNTYNKLPFNQYQSNEFIPNGCLRISHKY